MATKVLIRDTRIAEVWIDDLPEEHTDEDVAAAVAKAIGDIPFDEFVTDDWSEVVDIQEG